MDTLYFAEFDTHDYNAPSYIKNEFISFLNDVLEPVEIHDIFYNDNCKEGKVGVSATMLFSKENVKKLIAEYAPELSEKLNQLFLEFEHYAEKIVYDEYTIEFLNEKFNGDKYYFALSETTEYPKFSKGSFVFGLAQKGLISSEKQIPILNEIQNTLRDICFFTFKNWFIEKNKELRSEWQIKLHEKYEKLKKIFIRDNLYEQEVVNEKLKSILQ